MSYRIVPITEQHIDGFHAALDRVAREHRYLAFLEAPDIEVVRGFVRTNIQEGHPQLVAELGESVVGWCDILPSSRPVFRHCGVLGIGVVAEYRGRGIGKVLMKAALEAAIAAGITRVELTVRTDNTRAIPLYQAFGFTIEGRLRRHMLVTGEYHDSFIMALLVGEPCPDGTSQKAV
jgi:ribosomal protein S18 acetylase RimI-like enzyme